MDKDYFFNSFRDVAARAFYARQQDGESIKNNDLTLNSLKIIGPRFQSSKVFAQEDFNFGLRVLMFLQQGNISLSSDFTGSFDSLEPNPHFNKSDFLTSDEQADIISIHYIVRPPDNGEDLSKTQSAYIEAGGFSEKHHKENIWSQAAQKHDAKIIFTFGTDDEVSENTFKGSAYIHVHSQYIQQSANQMSVLIEKEYLEKISPFLNKNVFSELKDSSPSSTPVDRQQHMTAQL